MNRIIPIEPAPDYSEGLVTLSQSIAGGQNQIVGQSSALRTTRISVNPVPADAIPSNPTSWSWNIRQGDKIRFNDSGNYYTIAGPMRSAP